MILAMICRRGRAERAEDAETQSQSKSGERKGVDKHALHHKSCNTKRGPREQKREREFLSTLICSTKIFFVA